MRRARIIKKVIAATRQQKEVALRRTRLEQSLPVEVRLWVWTSDALTLENLELRMTERVNTLLTRPATPILLPQGPLRTRWYKPGRYYIMQRMVYPGDIPATMGTHTLIAMLQQQFPHATIRFVRDDRPLGKSS